MWRWSLKGFDENNKDNEKFGKMLDDCTERHEGVTYIAVNINDIQAVNRFGSGAKRTIRNLDCTWNGNKFTQDVTVIFSGVGFKILCEKPFDVSFNRSPKELWEEMRNLKPECFTNV